MSASTSNATPRAESAHSAEILKAATLLMLPGTVHELRVPTKVGRFKNSIAGYFDDPLDLAKAAATLDAEGHAGIYITLNPVNPALLSLYHKRIERHAEKTTSDADIQERHWLLIDCDPKRPAGISSTDEEHGRAVTTAYGIADDLGGRGFPDPVVADSGNGGHLLYRINANNTPAVTAQIKALLEDVAQHLAPDDVEVDITVSNAARITKLYGTMTCKGDSTKDRPHRRSRILEIPEPLQVLDMETVLGAAPKKDSNQHDNDGGNGRPRAGGFLEAFLEKHHIDARGPVAYQGGRKWTLAACPFNPEHTGTSAAIFELPNGRLGFTCLHAGCAGKHWQDFRELYEPGYRNSRNNLERECEPRPVKLPVASSADELLSLPTPEHRMLIEKLLPISGLTMLVGAHKSGKTVLAVQIGVALATGHPLMDNYPAAGPYSIIIVEEDDPEGKTSIADYLKVSPVPVQGNPNIFAFEKIGVSFGPEFYQWLEKEIVTRRARYVFLDSYTKLRPHYRAGGDIVKNQSDELTVLYEIGTRTQALILLSHHVSGGRISMEWSDQSAGTFAIGAAINSMIHISRFKEFPGSAPERLLQARGRHMQDYTAVLRFREPKLDYELANEGSAAPHWPLVCTIQKTFAGRPFTIKNLYQEIGVNRSTAYRYLNHLLAAGVLRRRITGEYVLEA